MTDLTPAKIVEELNRFVIGQGEAKRAVAVALRERWRRRQLTDDVRDEVYPKNILMIGPTGVGKTEIARRLAKLAKAPFLKVEATKFTEVGYVGRDVDAIVRDLVEAAIVMIRDAKRLEVQAMAHTNAEERVIDALVGDGAAPATRDAFRRKLRANELDDKEIDIEVADTAPSPMMEMPGQPGGAVGIGELNDLLSRAFGGRKKRRRMTVAQSHTLLVAEEADKLLDRDAIVRDAIEAVEQDGIVFIDEIDKVAARSEGRGADVSREGVQRDLLPLIEGATIATKHGPVKTDHILFIASGAFHVARPSDLLPELQGRLPIRVKLRALTEGDFVRILTEPDHSLTAQTTALLATEKVDVTFTDDGVAAIAAAAAQMNDTIENIGARRLHTLMERVLSNLSFEAPSLAEDARKIVIDSAYVSEQLGELVNDLDLGRAIL
ncbi:MAG: ATP-dependent protease ATPase subunit HslU [Neomegalonema sp.]|nr:ATP-dependent protease ATPase subunit HslU [Neomegalonema sp.]